MDLATMTMDRNEAREKFLEYKRSVQERHDDELEQIMHGYRAMSQGHQLISLRDTMQRGGTVERAYRGARWDNRAQRSVAVPESATLPALAVMRADQRQCWLETKSDGSATFLPEPYYRGRRDRIHLGDGTYTGLAWQNQWRAMVPIVPPGLRPKANLRNFHILWEAEWEKHIPPRPPGDPALLRRIGGDLFAVLAVWDLTPLEQAVLAGRMEQ